MPNNKNSSAPLMKGYLPVRVLLPSDDDETFFFVKEHFASDKCTLFLANVPVVPGISSKILLQSLLGRFASIQRVTVIENPRTTTTIKNTTTNSSPLFLGPLYNNDSKQGKFAHVVFGSNKEMKTCLRELTSCMSKKSATGTILPGLSLERLEIQTLQDETKRQEKTMAYGESDDENVQEESTKKGIMIVADRYRASCKALSRELLLEECNAVMEQYEDEEEAQQRAREASKSEPDEEGFVTVSYSSKTIRKRELEQGGRRKGSKRSRKKKDPNTGFTDFYRFQTKESRKRDLQDLRKKFEQDLAKVKKMKEERQYRPF